MVHCIYWGATDYDFSKYCILSMKIDFVSANRADSDEMVHYWHFIWVFTVFLKYLFRFLFIYLFYLILYVPPTIVQLNRDGSSWVEPVLS